MHQYAIATKLQNRRIRENWKGPNYGINYGIPLFFWGRASTLPELRLHSSDQVSELLCPNWNSGIALETISAGPPKAAERSLHASEDANN